MLFQEENVPLIAHLLMFCQSVIKASTVDFLNCILNALPSLFLAYINY